MRAARTKVPKPPPKPRVVDCSEPDFPAASFASSVQLFKAAAAGIRGGSARPAELMRAAAELALSYWLQKLRA